MSSIDDEDAVSSGPPPTKLASEVADTFAPETNTDAGSDTKSLETRLADLPARLNQLQRKQDELAQKQEAFFAKQEEADSVRRNQMDCISKRVFEAEKQLSDAQQLQDDAIAKANAVFEKHASEVAQSQDNLMSVITQVNRNFEHLSSEIAKHGDNLQGVQEDAVSMHLRLEQMTQAKTHVSHELKELKQQSTFMSSVYQTVQMLEQTLSEMQEQMQDATKSIAEIHSKASRSDLADLQSQLEDLLERTTTAESGLRGIQRSLAEERRAAASSSRPMAGNSPKAAGPDPSAMAQPMFSRSRSSPASGFGDELNRHQVPVDDMSGYPYRVHEDMGVPVPPSHGGMHFDPRYESPWREDDIFDAAGVSEVSKADGLRYHGMPPMPAMSSWPRPHHQLRPCDIGHFQHWDVEGAAMSDAENRSLTPPPPEFRGDRPFWTASA